MTEDDIRRLGAEAARADGAPPMPDTLVAKLGDLLRPADDKTKGGGSRDRTDEAA